MDAQHAADTRNLAARTETFFAALARLERPGMEHLSSRYKPLTLLWTLGTLADTGERLVPWALFRDEVSVILRTYGQWPENTDAQYPFWDLTNSPFWEFVSRRPNPRAPYSPNVEWLNRNNPSAGFSPDAAYLLQDPKILAATVNSLLERFFPHDAHGQLRHDLCRGLMPPTDGALVDENPPAPTGSRGRYLSDVRLRMALESHAVVQATHYYEARNWYVKDVGTRESYDLDLVHRLNGHVRHAEVKGSSAGVNDIELTRGEVNHSRNEIPCDLFVVENIAYDSSNNPIRTWGGRARIWRNWQPDESDLEASRYRYRLPPGQELAPDNPDEPPSCS